MEGRKRTGVGGVPDVTRRGVVRHVCLRSKKWRQLHGATPHLSRDETAQSIFHALKTLEQPLASGAESNDGTAILLLKSVSSREA
jgi:hypothetical protein